MADKKVWVDRCRELEKTVASQRAEIERLRSQLAEHERAEMRIREESKDPPTEIWPMQGYQDEIRGNPT